MSKLAVGIWKVFIHLEIHAAPQNTSMHSYAWRQAMIWAGQVEDHRVLTEKGTICGVNRLHPMWHVHSNPVVSCALLKSWSDMFWFLSGYLPCTGSLTSCEPASSKIETPVLAANRRMHPIKTCTGESILHLWGHPVHRRYAMIIWSQTNGAHVRGAHVPKEIRKVNHGESWLIYSARPLGRSWGRDAATPSLACAAWQDPLPPFKRLSTSSCL